MCALARRAPLATRLTLRVSPSLSARLAGVSSVGARLLTSDGKTKSGVTLVVPPMTTVMPLRWCGTCPACLAGNSHICQRLDFVGIDSPGSLQQRWNVPAGLLVRAGAAACGAAAAAAGCALVAGAAGGNALAGVLFFYIAVPSVISADTLGAGPAAGALARAATLVLELLPGVWRYAALAHGDPVGWIHAGCWAVGGVAGTAWLLSRRTL